VSVYIDSSALAKRYVREAEYQLTNSYLESVQDPITSVLTIVEVRRVIGRYVSVIEGVMAGTLLKRDLSSMVLVEVSPEIVENAAEIASRTQLRTLDSLHLASAIAVSCTQILTFDRTQAQVARSLGISPVILE
jgi:predicted nucleic acid-binding protein